MLQSANGVDHLNTALCKRMWYEYEVTLHCFGAYTLHYLPPLSPDLNH